MPLLKNVTLGVGLCRLHLEPRLTTRITTLFEIESRLICRVNLNTFEYVNVASKFFQRKSDSADSFWYSLFDDYWKKKWKKRGKNEGKKKEKKFGIVRPTDKNRFSCYPTTHVCFRVRSEIIILSHDALA